MNWEEPKLTLFETNLAHPKRTSMSLRPPVRIGRSSSEETTSKGILLEARKGHRFNVDPNKLVSNLEDSANFHNVEDGWEKVTNDRFQAFVHTKISSLLKGID